MSESRAPVPPVLNRRAFLQWSGLAALTLGLGGLARWAMREEIFLRPPGARPEVEFLARCLKCQRCIEVCPHNTLAPVLVSESPTEWGTPRLNFRAGYCDLCGQCTTACPSGALLPFDTHTVRLGRAEIRPDQCIAWNWGGCTVCFRQCPLHAVTLDDRQRPIVQADRCNGCGLCENICPSASLRSFTGERGRTKGIVVVAL